MTEGLKRFIGTLLKEARERSCGRNWLARLPFLLYFVFVLIRSLGDPSYRSLLSGLNLGLHELGHLAFSFFGQFLSMLGGTLLECLAPVFGMINFYRQKDFFAICLCFGWLSTVFFDVSVYVADARAMSLPLVSPFGSDSAQHDWNYLLGRMGMLQFDTFFAFMLRSAAVISMLVCIVSGAWLISQMISQDKTE